MRTSDKKLNPSLKKQIVNCFAQTLVDINNIQEANNFLKDFLSDAEAETLSKRLAVAYWLKKGRSYSNIKMNLKVSSATVAEVSSLINNSGYKTALQKIEAEEWANQWAEKISKTLPGGIKRFVGR